MFSITKVWLLEYTDTDWRRKQLVVIRKHGNRVFPQTIKGDQLFAKKVLIEIYFYGTVYVTLNCCYNPIEIEARQFPLFFQ